MNDKELMRRRIMVLGACLEAYNVICCAETKKERCEIANLCVELHDLFASISVKALHLSRLEQISLMREVVMDIRDEINGRKEK